MIPQNILKLIKSSNREDNILGLLLLGNLIKKEGVAKFKMRQWSQWKTAYYIPQTKGHFMSHSCSGSGVVFANFALNYGPAYIVYSPKNTHYRSHYYWCNKNFSKYE